MFTFELIAMVLALVLMFLVVGAKVMTAQILGRMKAQIARVAQLRQEATGRLKSVQGQKGVVEQNRAALNTKKTKLSKKVSLLKTELKQVEDEGQARQRRTEIRKVD
jgi:hypothetical protein